MEFQNPLHTELVRRAIERLRSVGDGLLSIIGVGENSADQEELSGLKLDEIRQDTDDPNCEPDTPIVNTAKNIGKPVMDFVSGRRYTDRLVEEGEEDRLHDAEEILKLYENQGDTEGARVQELTIARVVAQTFIRLMDGGNFGAAARRLKIFKEHMARVGGNASLKDLGLTQEEIDYLNRYADLRDIED